MRSVTAGQNGRFRALSSFRPGASPPSFLTFVCVCSVIVHQLVESSSEQTFHEFALKRWDASHLGVPTDEEEMRQEVWDKIAVLGAQFIIVQSSTDPLHQTRLAYAAKWSLAERAPG